MQGFNFDQILNLLARTSARTPSPSPQDSYQYFWGDHPEKNRTVQARYDAFGGQAEPLGGEIGRTGPSVQYGGQEYLPQMPDQINRLPIKLRQKYLALMGPVLQNTQGGWQ